MNGLFYGASHTDFLVVGGACSYAVSKRQPRYELGAKSRSYPSICDQISDGTVRRRRLSRRRKLRRPSWSSTVQSLVPDRLKFERIPKLSALVAAETVVEEEAVAEAPITIQTPVPQGLLPRRRLLCLRPRLPLPSAPPKVDN